MFEVRPLTNQTWADLEELFDLLAEDAAYFGCAAEVACENPP